MPSETKEVCCVRCGLTRAESPICRMADTTDGAHLMPSATACPHTFTSWSGLGLILNCRSCGAELRFVPESVGLAADVAPACSTCKDTGYYESSTMGTMVCCCSAAPFPFGQGSQAATITTPPLTLPTDTSTSDLFVRAMRGRLRLPKGVERPDARAVLEFITRSSYPTAPDPLAAVACAAAELIQAMHDELHEIAAAERARKNEVILPTGKVVTEEMLESALLAEPAIADPIAMQFVERENFARHMRNVARLLYEGLKKSRVCPDCPPVHDYGEDSHPCDCDCHMVYEALKGE